MTRKAAPGYWESDFKKPGLFLSYRHTDIMAAVALDELLTPYYGDETIFRADRSLQRDDSYKISYTLQ